MQGMWRQGVCATQHGRSTRSFVGEGLHEYNKQMWATPRRQKSKQRGAGRPVGAALPPKPQRRGQLEPRPCEVTRQDFFYRAEMFTFPIAKPVPFLPTLKKRRFVNVLFAS